MQRIDLARKSVAELIACSRAVPARIMVSPPTNCLLPHALCFRAERDS